MQFERHLPCLRDGVYLLRDRDFVGYFRVDAGAVHGLAVPGVPLWNRRYTMKTKAASGNGTCSFCWY